MALRGERVIIETDITLSSAAVTSRGCVMAYSTSGSGVAIGDSAGTVDKFASASGKVPAGILLQDVVSTDQSRYHLNFHKEEVPSGAPVTLVRKGRLTTNEVTGTPAVGGTAYLTSNGQVTPTMSATGGLSATPKVGQFVSIKDADGYVTIDVNLPVV
jgi:hypothetical protein